MNIKIHFKLKNHEIPIRNMPYNLRSLEDYFNKIEILDKWQTISIPICQMVPVLT